MKRMSIAICALLLCLLGTEPCVADERYDDAIKITILSWMTGSTKVSYEHAFDNHQTAEVCASLIGAGFDKFQNNPRGYTLRYAHKFFLAGNDESNLNGFYVRPEFIYSNYTYNSAITTLRTPAQMGALLATTGYQISYKRLLVDAWVGGGYAMGVPAETGYHHGFALWNLFGSRNDNIALSFSIRLGYCF